VFDLPGVLYGEGGGHGVSSFNDEYGMFMLTMRAVCIYNQKNNKNGIISEDCREATAR
jgi:hypothetical protein